MLIVPGGKMSHATGIVFTLIMHNVPESLRERISRIFYLPPDNRTHSEGVF